MSSANKRKITIVGAGLIGSAAAIILSKRGYSVTVYERGPDMRDPSWTSISKSINLVLTPRGIRALQLAGIEEEVLRLGVRVEGRMMHQMDTNEKVFQPYGVFPGEWNYSINRTDLNIFLLNKAHQHGATLYFNHRLLDVDFQQGTLVFEFENKNISVVCDSVIAADGGGSAARYSLWNQGRVYAKEDHSPFSYKELTFPLQQSTAADGTTTKTSPMEGNSLHIWPRGKHFLMGLANKDGSFTGTIYLPRTGEEETFDNTHTEKAATDLFRKYYRSAIPLLGGEETAVRDYLRNPCGFLGTVRCHPWEHQTEKLSIVLVGDAAHAIVPFFGQGLNSGLEDLSVLCTALDDFQNWHIAIREFCVQRKAATEAIADMALENFVEMREKVGDKRFTLLKQVEHLLEERFPKKFRSRYALVVYSHNPYHTCQRLGFVNTEVLEELTKNITTVDEVDLAKAEELIDKKVTPMIKALGVTLDFSKVPPIVWSNQHLQSNL